MSRFQVDHIEQLRTELLSPIMSDYLTDRARTQRFFHLDPSEEGLQKARSLRKGFEYREVLSDRLMDQNKFLDLSEATRSNITKLKDTSTYTVTTGHQLCLMTGPLYFIHKIISVIKLAEILNAKHPNEHHVPVFWMASEDHDLEEVDHFYAFERTFRWKAQQTGAVGRMDVSSVQTVLDEVSEHLGKGDNAEELIRSLEAAYVPGRTLADATRFLVNGLFGKYGIVIIDGDDKAFKELFKQEILNELVQRSSGSLIQATTESADWNYKVQMNPREINLFYLEKHSRQRIEWNQDDLVYEIGERSIAEQDLFKELEEYPERFSPNVALRPVYQEKILPNIAYVGGGGELAYWLQLKTAFEHFGVSMPVLLLRDHALWLSAKTSKRVQKYGLSSSDLFKNVDDLIRSVIRNDHDAEVSLEAERAELNELFGKISERLISLDATLEKSAMAARKRSFNALERMEKSMMRVVKRNEQDKVNALRSINATVYPNGTLQERKINFSQLYVDHGKEMFDLLLKEFDPLNNRFLILSELGQ